MTAKRIIVHAGILPVADPPFHHDCMMPAVRPPSIAIITSADGGLAHYVVHLWKALAPHMQPYYVTYKDRDCDDLVREQLTRVEPLLDPKQDASIADVIDFLRCRRIPLVNLQIASPTLRHLSYFLALARKLREEGIRIVATIHNVMPLSILPVDLGAVRRLYELADGYLVGNEVERRCLYELIYVGQRPVSVAPHGPYLLFDHHRYDRMSARQLFGLPPHGRIVLFFGFLRPDKDMDCLLRAWPLLRRKVAQATLFISVCTRYMPEWHEKVVRLNSEEDGISARDTLTPALEIEAVFKAANVVALPYQRATQSGIWNLAKAFALPVIVTDVFARTAAVLPPGRVVPAGDETALANSLAEVLTSSENPCRDVDACRLDMPERNEDWEHNAAALAQVCRSVLA